MFGVTLFLAAAATLSSPQPRPEPVHTFKNWMVGCDNIARCRAVSLMQDEDDALAIPIAITRGPDPDDEPLMELDIGWIDEEFRFALDDEWLPPKLQYGEGSLTYRGSEALGLIRRIADHDMIVARDPNGSPSGSFRERWYGRVSLSGLKAALLYMDEKQHRLGSSTAFVRPGAKLMERLRPPRSSFRERPAQTAKPARPIPSGMVAQRYAALGCSAEDISTVLPPVSERLDTDHSVLVIPWPCGNGAYNFFGEVWVMGETGPAKPARFEMAAGMTDYSDDHSTQGSNDGWDNIVVNAHWNPVSRQLEIFAMGRGLGDCGRKRSFYWDGTRFRLAEQEDMPECRGANQFIRTYSLTLTDQAQR